MISKKDAAMLRDNLGESFHTAFRKATDCPQAHKIWMLIREMPDQEFANVIDFVADGCGIPQVKK